MLLAGAAVPHVQVWTAPREEARPLREVLGAGYALLCFYVWDWSPTWTNELLLLRDRSNDLEAAGIRALAISRDSPWSHRAWAEALGVDVPLLSDWNGDATRAFDVTMEPLGMQDVPVRSCFLIEDGETVVESWLLGGELPDIAAIVEVARAASEPASG